MYELTLCKGKSYTGFIHATEKEPKVTVKTKQEAEQAVATGYFKIIRKTEGEERIETSVNFEKMTIPQIDTYATEHGIDLSGSSNRAEKLEKIRLKSKSESKEEPEAEPDFEEVL